MTQDRSSDHSQVGKRFQRPDLTAAQLESSLKCESRKLKGLVLHDEALIRQPEQPDQDIQNADIETSLKNSREAGNGFEATISEIFWQLQQNICKLISNPLGTTAGMIDDNKIP